MKMIVLVQTIRMYRIASRCLIYLLNNYPHRSKCCDLHRHALSYFHLDILY